MGKGDDDGDGEWRRRTMMKDGRQRKTNDDGGWEREDSDGGRGLGPRWEKDARKRWSTKVQFVCPLTYAVKIMQ